MKNAHTIATVHPIPSEMNTLGVFPSTLSSPFITFKRYSCRSIQRQGEIGKEKENKRERKREVGREGGSLLERERKNLHSNISGQYVIPIYIFFLLHTLFVFYQVCVLSNIFLYEAASIFRTFYIRILSSTISRT